MGLFFTEGGVGMYPTLVFGFALVAAAALSIPHPHHRWLTFVLGALTATSGVLGTCLGLINTMKYVARAAPDVQLGAGATGVAESLNNLVLAAVLVILALLLSTMAAVKNARLAPKA
ncbi:MAG: hypothetical protein IAE78_01185 [Myxococcus sp.]|nr:hypothetical protein [Myxococcus sp.]